MEKKLYWEDDSDRKLAVKLLQEENILAGSSDTVPGLFAVPSEKTFQALNQIKGRFDKPYLVIARSFDDIEQLTDMFSDRNNTEESKLALLAERFWPGPLTLIIPAKPTLPGYLSGNTGNIAVRIPNYPPLQKVLAEVPLLFSTSANLAGQPVPDSVAEIDQHIQKNVALVIDSEKKHASLPSTIVDCTGPDLKLVREGAIPFKDIEMVLNERR